MVFSQPVVRTNVARYVPRRLPDARGAVRGWLRLLTRFTGTEQIGVGYDRPSRSQADNAGHGLQDS